LNMAISFVLVFLAVIITFVDSILPTHILYHPEHENNLNSSLGLLKVIGQKFLRYIVAQVPLAFWGAVLLVIPVIVMSLTLTLTDNIKNGVLETKIENLQGKVVTMEALDAHRAQLKINRLEMYRGMPENAPAHFGEMGTTHSNVKEIKQDIVEAEELLLTRTGQFQKDMADISASIELAKTDIENPEQLAILSSDRLTLEENHLSWEKLSEKPDNGMYDPVDNELNKHDDIYDQHKQQKYSPEYPDQKIIKKSQYIYDPLE